MESIKHKMDTMVKEKDSAMAKGNALFIHYFPGRKFTLILHIPFVYFIW